MGPGPRQASWQTRQVDSEEEGGKAKAGRSEQLRSGYFVVNRGLIYLSLLLVISSNAYGARVTERGQPTGQQAQRINSLEDVIHVR